MNKGSINFSSSPILLPPALILKKIQAISTENWKGARLRFIKCLVAISALFFFSGCTSIYRYVPQAPLSHKDISAAIYRIKEQGEKVHSFTSLGTILVRDWIWESEADCLMACTREPFMIKIEITHPWGQPILHILINKTGLEAFSFTDNKFYTGTFTPEAISRFIPGNFNSSLIWATLRGYPNLLGYNRIASLKGNRISLFNKREEKVEVIDVYPDSLFPMRVYFPENRINLTFSDYKEKDGIYYAGEVKVDNVRGEKDLIFKRKKIIFNKVIPGQIFNISKPPVFDTIYLDELPNG